MPEDSTPDVIPISRETARFHLSRLELGEASHRARLRADGAAAASGALRWGPDGSAPWRLGRRRRLARSGLFLGRWYAAGQGIRPGDASRHFLAVGIPADHAPNPFFDSAWYRRAHLDGAPDEAPIAHYLRIGAANALATGPLFDPIAYLAHNPDLAGEPDLLAHLLRRGLREGRRFLPVD
ncbi:hypothetical protein [uncultured Sphingomonas sp.]|uniref:hypothetical protein n=1 Tax=uncultured Sphingomonas sp. TaxID=158754 RepID=UPI0035C9C731